MLVKLQGNIGNSINSPT
jgi:hypothetical protein